MERLYRLISFVPLSLHAAWAAATADHLPSFLGRTADSAGTPTDIALAAWTLLILLCNFAFVLLYLRMPRFKDATLSLPGLPRGPLSPETRAALIDRLRAVAQTAVLGLNIFFLAIYQAVYQANTGHPILRFPPAVLLVGFMILPILLIALHILLAVLAVRAEAEQDGTP